MRRIDEIIVAVVVREYNDEGRPIDEKQSKPVKLFRATNYDVWACLDAALDAIEEPNESAPLD